MMIKTTENNDDKEWQILSEYLQQASPEQWHIFAARSNYDGNSPALNWLIDNPKIDRATALLIYWYMGAAWYVQFSSEDEMESYEQETYHILQKIEQRYLSGFYADYGIWFDPMHSEGGRPDDYPDKPVNRAILPVMLEAVGGSEYVDLDSDEYDDGVPLPIAERIFELYS